MKKLLLITFGVLFFNSGCNKEEKFDEVIMYVASEMCWGSTIHGTQELYIVKFDESEPWDSFGLLIAGFDYERGYEYILRLKYYFRHPDRPDIADWIPDSYELWEIISKEKKDTDLTDFKWPLVE